MSFNSFAFAAFVPVVFAIYWLAASHRRLQNLLIVLASLVFYGWRDPWLDVLLSVMTLVAYLVRPRTRLQLALAILTTCLPLVFFNYTSQTLISAVGLSFTVFQAISYFLDVYMGTIARVRDFTAFAAYMTFFPQLLAGPIERAGNLCEQFLKPRVFDRPLATIGCRQFLWGLFSKCVVADNCAEMADRFLNSPQANGLAYLLGVLFFSIQIYADFAGYSDMALGVADLFGIRLKRNFAFPYFAKDMADFWRRWHISLTSWLRDYIYIPLGGNRRSVWRVAFNTMIVFIVSGVWHGCGWTYFCWGALHGLFLLPRVFDIRFLRNSRVTMLVCAYVGWAFFRAPDISTAVSWSTSWLDFAAWSVPISFGEHVLVACSAAILFFLIEWLNRNEAYGCARLPRSLPMRWLVYLILVSAIVFGAPGSQSFVYYQF